MYLLPGEVGRLGAFGGRRGRLPGEVGVQDVGTGGEGSGHPRPIVGADLPPSGETSASAGCDRSRPEQPRGARQQPRALLALSPHLLLGVEGFLRLHYQ